MQSTGGIRTMFMLIAGILFVSAGLNGRLGSMLAAIIDTKALQKTG